MNTKKISTKDVDFLLRKTRNSFPHSIFFKEYDKEDKVWIIYTTNLDLYSSDMFHNYIESIIDTPYDKVCFLYSKTERLVSKKSTYIKSFELDLSDDNKPCYSDFSKAI